MTKSHWLDRLHHVTDYRELRNIFSEMQTAAALGSAELAAQIDEAIRRMRYETKRDDDEMQRRNQAYGAFRSEQKGCLGWLMRHLPGSRTNRQEREHVKRIAQQQSELLANQLVIARAEMLGERLRSPESRAVGAPLAMWEARFEGLASERQLESLGAHLQKLDEETLRGAEFLESLNAAIEGFAKANFTVRDEIQWRDQDVGDARNEFQELRGEVDEKQSLRAAKTELAIRLVDRELANADGQYREWQSQQVRMQKVLAANQPAHQAAQHLLDQLTRFAATMDQAAEIPNQRVQLERELHGWRSQWDRGAAAAQQLQNELSGYQDRMGRAAREAAHLESSMRSAEKMFRAYLAEQGIVEEPPPGHRVYSSSVASEFNRLKRDWQQSQQQSQLAQREFQKAQQRAQQASNEASTARQKLDACQQQLAELDRKEQQLRGDAEQLRRELPAGQQQLLSRWQQLSNQRSDVAAESPQPLVAGVYALEQQLSRLFNHVGGFQNPLWQQQQGSWLEAIGNARRLTDSLARDQAELQSKYATLHEQCRGKRLERLTAFLGERLVDRIRQAGGG